MSANSPFWIELTSPGRLAILARPRGGDWLEDDILEWKRAGIDTVVSLLTEDEVADLNLLEEDRFAASSGLQFHTFPIPDREVPESRRETTEIASLLAGEIASGKNIGFHCRQGVGRSALLAACVLIALGLSPEEAINCVTKARGLPTPETVEQKKYIFDFAKTFNRVPA